MVQTAKFWDRLAERYSRTPLRDEEAYLKKLEITRTYLQPDSEVFEFGCGTGTTAIAHAPFVSHILAIDISSKMLEIAEHKAETASIDNITFEKNTIEQCDQDAESFDVIMGHSILHLLRSPEQVLAKLFRLLKPGGVFVSSTACLGDELHWRVLATLLNGIRVIPYVNVMSRNKLESLLSSTGFEPEFAWERRKGQAAFIIVRKPAG